MGRRRKRRQSGPEELIVGLVFMFGGWITISGGGPAGFLKNLFAVILLMLVVGAAVVAYRAWSSRRGDRTVFSTAPTHPQRAGRIEPQGPDLVDRVRSRRDPLTDTAALAERPTAWTMDVISALEWKRFEELCQGFWKAKGYPADLTGPGADGGVDVFIRDQRDASVSFPA